MGRNQIRTTKTIRRKNYGSQENTPIEETEWEYSQLATQIHALKKQGGVILTADFNAKLEVNTNHVKQTK